MEKELRESLKHLAQIDPNELQVVLRYARWRRFCHDIAVIPFPIKVGIAHAMALFLILALISPGFERPVLVIPFLWGGAYAIGFSIAALLPHHAPVRLHWVK